MKISKKKIWTAFVTTVVVLVASSIMIGMEISANIYNPESRPIYRLILPIIWVFAMSFSFGYTLKKFLDKLPN